MTPIISLDNIVVQFGALRAIDDVSIKINEGERRAIIGPNGAGKTTLFNVISGLIKPTVGQVFYGNENITKKPVHMRTRMGICRTFQITNLFLSLTVFDNMILALYGNSPKKYAMFKGRSVSGDDEKKIARALSFSGLSGKEYIPVSQLSYGEQRQLELAMVLTEDPKVLLLDEPAAGLSQSERSRLAKIIQELPKHLTVVLIDHDMGLVLNLVEYISVLSNGHLLTEGTPSEIKDNAEVQNVYFGKVDHES